MTRAELDTEYHGRWDIDQKSLTGDPSAACNRWSGEGLGLNCMRPVGHVGDHAAVLGMDPDVNDWVRWAK